MYTNSALATVIGSGTEKCSARKHKTISRITVHQAAGVVSLDGLNTIINDPDRNVSWHYGIDSKGNIGQFVDEQFATRSSNNTENDDVAINIIVSNSANTRDYPVSDKAYKALIRLCVDICERNEIELKYTGRPEDSTLTMHRWYHRTICPGPYLAARFSDLAIQVNTTLATKVQKNYGVKLPSASAVRTGSTYTPSDLIDYNSLKPFIVVFDYNVTTKVKWNKLTKLGVAGVLLVAGWLYEHDHTKHASYRNPNLRKQIKSCEEAEFPYGLIVPVRARTEKECVDEIAALRDVLRTTVSSLGIWLELDLKGDKKGKAVQKTINNSIIQTYVTELKRLGFNNQIGVYATAKQLKRIDWADKFSSVTLLCMSDHPDQLDTIQALMTPSFFVPESK